MTVLNLGHRLHHETQNTEVGGVTVGFSHERQLCVYFSQLIKADNFTKINDFAPKLNYASFLHEIHCNWLYDIGPTNIIFF